MKLLANPELGVMTTILFVGVYTYPFLTFDHPGKTFRFIFAAWAVHIALIGLSGVARSRVDRAEAPDTDIDPEPAK